jgi:hypothetical protein
MTNAVIIMAVEASLEESGNILNIKKWSNAKPGQIVKKKKKKMN